MPDNNFSDMWFETDRIKRENLQDAMQNIVDKTSKREFDSFDENPELKTDNPLFQYYDNSLERIIEDVPGTQVAPGCVVIWYLYNMGVVIKTPQVCFGVDIHHRHAIKLEPLLDFIVITHNHLDHYSVPLLRMMNENEKAIVSNFYPSFAYTKAAEFTHNINGVTIHCGEANHNNKLKKFTMPAEIVCPTGDRNFVFYTSGDCYSHEFLSRKTDKIDLYAVHPRCGMTAVCAAQKLEPEMTFILHLHELGHEINEFRWEYSVGRCELAEFEKTGLKAYVPVWGEKFLWDGEKITGCQPDCNSLAIY